MPNLVSSGGGRTGGGSSGGGGSSTPTSPLGKAGGYIGHRWRQAGGFKGVGLNYIRGSKKMALKMFGAAAGMTAGAPNDKSFEMGVVGYGAGGAIADKREQKQISRRIEKNERYFAGAYEDYKAAHPGMSDADAQRNTRAMLGMTESQISALSADDQRYARFARGMNDTYQQAGMDKTEDKVMNTLKDIQDGKIYPK